MRYVFVGNEVMLNVIDQNHNGTANKQCEDDTNTLILHIPTIPTILPCGCKQFLSGSLVLDAQH